MSTVDQRHQTPHRAFGSRTEDRVAIGLGIAGLLIAAAALVVSNPTTRDVLWSAGFGVLFLALVATVVGVVHARGQRLSALPTSVAGWVALTCFGVGVVLLFTPVAEISLALGLVSAASAIGALGSQGERSLPVMMLPLLGGMFVLAFVLGELLIGHE
jgi:hypothetical protein